MRDPGVYTELSNADYHADRGAIGASGLKAVLKAPAFYWGQYLDPNCPSESERESPGRRFGNLVHACLFEPQHFNQRHHVGPAVPTRAAKAWKDFCAGLPPGCNAITPEEYAAMQQVRRSVMSIPDMASALSTGLGEVSAYAVDDATGVRVKVRPDWVHDLGGGQVVIIDGKTLNTADENEFARQAARMHYALQGALYSDFYAKAAGVQVAAFIFLVISDDHPHLANAVMLGERSLNTGRAQYRRALNQYAECQRTGVWPGHGNEVKIVDIPDYAQEA